MKKTRTRNRIVSVSVCALVAALICLSAPAYAGTVTITGKLVDRVCTVEDTFQLQPSTEKRCTLYVKESWASGGCLSGVCSHVVTVYCPNKAADDRPFNGAYHVCSDPAAMQINHPSANYTITGWTRTVAQQADGNGQFQGYQFSY